ncbi:GyrI-like domain-containing protein [Granulicella sp. WH15]|uniref:GyrI-like domain-containing protein n=1 Tax=Granulicella sp. WH15 TaxID=2602070 RepID=UPI0013A572B4|nr:GyrI-like domain-containing protein [Granulicella sp. WH15]
MSNAVQDVRAFTVLGLAARASNAAPEAIGALWGQVYAAGGAQSIAARLDDTIYSVYCEYEGDHTNPYTVVIGCAVAPDAATFEGMRKIHVDAGRFAVFPATGELPQSVMAAWAEVWRTPLERRYQADFERYENNSSATIYVGVQ